MFITDEEGVIEIEVKFLIKIDSSISYFPIEQVETKPEFQKGYVYLVNNFGERLIGSQISKIGIKNLYGIPYYFIIFEQG